jgi:hypothetical protein
MHKKVLLLLILFILALVVGFFVVYKPKDPFCDAQAKESTKEQFFQKGPYEEAYKECLKQK